MLIITRYCTRLAVMIAMLISFSVNAQNRAAGQWVGLLNAGAVKLRIVFHVADSNGKLSATMDSPDQGTKGIKVPRVTQTGDSLFLQLGMMVGYRGRLLNDSTLEGVWVQGQSIPLSLRKAELMARKRPQTPVPPFPYKSEDVTFSNKAQTITYGATITIPPGKGKSPAILLITGSGPQNRDEEIMEHKPFAVLADYLTRRGYIVLRVDDRGIGQTTGNPTTSTTADFADDAAAALDYLETRPELDRRKIGLLGHSEGGLIAAMLAAERKDLAFIISLAGPGVKILNTMIAQNDAVLEKKGLDSASRAAYLKLYAEIVQTLPRYRQQDSLIASIEQIAASWRQTTPEQIVATTTGITEASSQHAFASSFARSINNPWTRYFMASDPTPYIKKISCKVLALNGSEDIQVVSKLNLEGWRQSLRQSKSKAYEVKELPGLNHLFQKCNTCDTDEYGELEETFSPAALEVIGSWLHKEIY